MNEWNNVWEAAGPHVRQRVYHVVHTRSQALVDDFYRSQFADAQAAELLDHEVVNRRLRGAMAHWLETLFDPQIDAASLDAQQCTTGEAHARVGVPMSLVTRGSRALKRTLCARLQGLDVPSDDMIRAVSLVHESIDLAMDQINATYVKAHSRLTRAEEAYRHIFLSQNLQAERERQRSLLLEWTQSLLLGTYLGPGDSPMSAGITRFDHSQFGLWLHHKASVMFEGAPELDVLHRQVQDIEQRLLVDFGGAQGDIRRTREVAAQIHAAIERMKSLLGSLFDRVQSAGDAHDAVTRLLHRRYLPTVVRREIELCRRGQTPFALLLVEIDQFEPLGALLGAEGTDLIVTQVASLLADGVRAGDFVFRIGEHRFAVLAVEVSPSDAERIADGLRQRIESAPLRTPGDARTQIGVHIGTASFDGHPDYLGLLQRAEAALRVSHEATPAMDALP
jgi:diguanylate cyclase